LRSKDYTHCSNEREDERGHWKVSVAEMVFRDEWIAGVEVDMVVVPLRVFRRRVKVR
jgi:hypothetical protein